MNDDWPTQPEPYEVLPPDVLRPDYEGTDDHIDVTDERS